MKITSSNPTYLQTETQLPWFSQMQTWWSDWWPHIMMKYNWAVQFEGASHHEDVDVNSYTSTYTLVGPYLLVNEKKRNLKNQTNKPTSMQKVSQHFCYPVNESELIATKNGEFACDMWKCSTGVAGMQVKIATKYM